jgi:hypothetical protein
MTSPERLKPQLILILAPGLFAQSSVTGSIQGTVLDATGSAVPQVHILARNAASGNSRAAETSVYVHRCRT